MECVIGVAGKAECKAALQKELGFNVDPKVPLVGWIGRLDFQKGPDIILQSIGPMAQRGCQVCLHHQVFLLGGAKEGGGGGGGQCWNPLLWTRGWVG